MTTSLAGELLARIGPVRDIRGDMIYGLLGFVQGEPRLGRRGTTWTDAREWGWRSDVPWDPELDRSSVVDPVLFEQCIQLAVLQLHPTAPALDLQSAQPQPEAPVAGWRAVAAVLNTSEDTVARRRKRVGDQHPASFPDAEAVWSWWRGLHEIREPPPAPATAPTPTPSVRRRKAAPRGSADDNANPMEIIREGLKRRKG